MSIYSVDIRDTSKNDRVLAKDVQFERDMFDVDEEVLLLKLTLATIEMGNYKANKRNGISTSAHDYAHPQSDYRADIRKVTRQVVVTYHSTTIATGV